MGHFPQGTLAEGTEGPTSAGAHHPEVPQPMQQLPGSWLVPLIFPAQVSIFCPKKTDLKDYALPNPSWCPDMLSLYQEFLEKTKTNGWVKIPSFKSNKDHLQGFKLPSTLAVTSGKAWPERAPGPGSSRPAQPPSLCSEALGREGHEPPPGFQPGLHSGVYLHPPCRSPRQVDGVSCPLSSTPALHLKRAHPRGTTQELPALLSAILPHPKPPSPTPKGLGGPSPTAGSGTPSRLRLGPRRQR